MNLKKLLPIIIGFPIDGELLPKLVSLNNTCDKEKGVDFDIHIPHITLWMGFIKEEDLNTVIKDFYHIFRSISIALTIEKGQIFSGVNGDVLSFDIAFQRELFTLQNRIFHFWEPYRVVTECYQGFNASTLAYVNDFSEHSLTNYEPHITVGFSSEIIQLNVKKFTVENPEIFLMGNNCTCLKVISV